MTEKIKFAFEGDPRDLKRALGDVREAFGETESSFASNSRKMVTAVGAAFAADAIIDFGTELFNMGTELETWSVKAETVFGDQLAGVQEWADANNEAMGVTDDRLVSMATNMADLLKPMGFTSEAAAGMSTDMLELSGALSAWSGGQRDAAEVSEILSKAMLGEREQLKELGISINQAEVDQRAMAMAQAEGRTEITAMDKALATQQLILEKSTDAQAAWADGSFDALKQQNELRAEVSELKEDLATALIPVFQWTVDVLVNDVVPAVKTVIEWFQAQGETYEAIGEIATTVFEWFETDGLPAMQAFAEGTVAAFEWLWNFFEPVIRGMGEQIYNLVQLGIDVIDFFKNVFQGEWGAAWDSLKNVVSEAVELIIDPLDNMIDFMGNLGEAMKSAAGNVFGWLLEGFRENINGLIRIWNNLSFTFPSFSGDWNGPLPGGGFTVGGWTMNTPNISEFHQEGVFRAPRPGGEGIAIVRDGEPIGQGVTSTYQKGSRGRGETIVLQVDRRVLGRVVRDELRDLSIREGAIPVFVQDP